MAEVDPVILQIRAELDGYNAKVRAVANSVERNLERQNKAVQNLERQFRSSSSAIAMSVGGLGTALAGAFSVQQVTAMIDNFTRLQNSLRVAGLEGANLESVQGKLLDLSSKYGVNINELANLYGKSTQAASDLGASESQLLQITEASAQALKITGTSAVQAQGALLGLTQALASGTVRAEEFNQINEGGLRPLLQVVANTEKYGGSVAKLRQAVVDGKVSSQEFYTALLNGSQQLGDQASKATLTLAGAFEALASKMTVYVGQAAATNGVTNALAQGIKALADNLDTLFNVLAVIAVAGFGRFTAGAVIASGAIRSISAYAAIATTSLAGTALAARGLGAAMIGAMGGPVMAAVTALAVGIGYLATRTSEAEETAMRYRSALDVASNGKSKATELSMRYARAIGAERAEIEKTIDAELRLAKARAAAAKSEVAKATARVKSDVSTLRVNNAERAAGRRNNFDAANKQTLASVESLKTATAALETETYTIRELLNAKKGNGPLGSGSGAVPAASTGGGGRKKTGGGSGASGGGASGPSDSEIEDRFNSQLASLTQQTLSARQRIATSAEEQAELELRAVELARLQAVDEINASKEFSKVHKARLQQQVEALADAERDAIEFQKQARLDQEARDLAQERYNGEADALRLQGDLADSQKERRDIALKLVDLEYQYQRSLLESVIASDQASDADKERARIALANLNAQRAGQVARAKEQTQTPAEAFLDEIRKSSDEMNEDLERVAVSGLNDLNDGIVDAIMGAKSLGDVFKDVANSIIRDLLRIAIQQALIKPLAESLFGGGGGGGLGGLFGGGLGGIFGGKTSPGTPPINAPIRAGGGRVEVGRIYRVNESGQEYLQPLVNGAVRTPSQAKAMGAGGQSSPSVVKLYVDEGAMFAPRVQQISGQVSVEVVREAAPYIRDAAVSETARQMNKPTIR